MTTAIDQPKEPEAAPPPPPAPAAGDGHGFLGHPGGLATLSGLEVWERFSFLGMQAILVLYFADTAAHGGLGMDPGTAASVTAAYGTWTGLGLISAGTGLLKPNVASMVGRLYRTDDERRDAGFALHYTAITTGAFAGPLIAGWLGEHQGWHRGFSAAAVGMTAGLAQYVLGRNRLPDRDAAAPYALAPDARRTALRRIAAGGLLLAALATLLAAIGWLTMPRFVDLLTLVSVIAPVLYFTLMFRSPRVRPPNADGCAPTTSCWRPPACRPPPDSPPRRTPARRWPSGSSHWPSPTASRPRWSSCTATSPPPPASA
ncbi:POT family protein [Streptomyces sp. Ag109_G2-6]|nr:POT family protein [Streptomyces sp. Ag109_G2-6]